MYSTFKPSDKMGGKTIIQTRDEEEEGVIALGWEGDGSG